MADVDISHNCGCGYKSRSLEAAVRHSDTEHHTLTVLGTIRPASETIDKMAWARKAPVIDETPASLSRIEAVRHKLNGGR